MKKQVIGVTGHRTLSHNNNKIIEKFLKTLESLSEIDTVLTGMAIGYDQLVAEICLAANIKYIAVVPFEGQEKKWPIKTQKRYHELLKKAHEIKIVSSGKYEAWKMHARNKWIVNNSETILAYFDGKYAKNSGTSACVQYAEKQNKQIINIYDLSSTCNF